MGIPPTCPGCGVHWAYAGPRCCERDDENGERKAVIRARRKPRVDTPRLTAAERRTRQDEIIALRVAGRTWREVATELGYPSERSAYLALGGRVGEVAWRRRQSHPILG